MRGAAWVLVVSLGLRSVAGQVVAPAQKAMPEVRDEAVDAAAALIGQATILRGFFGGGELAYDTAGRVKGQPKVLDWTLAAVDVQMVSRVGPAQLQLDGVRVAIRYNPEQHTFDRHPLKDTKVRIGLAVTGDGRSVQAALTAMFSVGIDPALQRSMPPYWNHYFMPGQDWGPDDLAGQTIVPANAPPGAGLEYPVLEKRGEPEGTSEVARDKVKGIVQLKIVIGIDGVPRRIVIRQPLGYGLDERAVAAVANYRFRPGTRAGQPIAVEIIVNQGFELGSGLRWASLSIME